MELGIVENTYRKNNIKSTWLGTKELVQDYERKFENKKLLNSERKSIK